MKKLFLFSIIIGFCFFYFSEKSQAQTKCEADYYQGQCVMSCGQSQTDIGQKDCPNNFTCCASSCSDLGGSCVESDKCLEKMVLQWNGSLKTLNQECDNEGKICCKKSITDCSGKPWGEECYIPSGEKGYCYNGKCETEKGVVGEPCGNEEGSKCVKNAFCKNQDLGGRSCQSGFTCCEEDGVIDNTCTSGGGECSSQNCKPDFDIAANLNVGCQATFGDKYVCCLPNECAKQGGECMDSCSGNYNILVNEEADESCGDTKVCCELSLCAKKGGQCVPNDQTCDNPFPQYDNTCFGTFKCCGPIKPPSEVCKDYGEGLEGGFLFFKGSLVPCGRHCDDPGTELDETDTCTLCHFIILFKRLYDLLFSMLIIVSLVMITVGGVIYIVSTGNPGLTGIAKGLVTKTLTGFGLFLLSWLLVFTVLKFISANTEFLGDGKENWFEFTCDTESKFDAEAEGKDTTTTPTPTTPSVPTQSGYTYDPGIESQMKDASASLVNLLNCMQPKLSDGAKRISSISDSAGIDKCANNYSKPPCAHKENSCHYGGITCKGKSYAIDFGDENAINEITKAAKECDPGAYVLKEGDHVHVSVSNNCGCK